MKIYILKYNKIAVQKYHIIKFNYKIVLSSRKNKIKNKN